MKYLNLIILSIALNGCELADPPNPTPTTDCIPMDFLHDINADTQQALGNTFEPPANAGTMQGDPSLPQTLIRPAGVNAPMLEIIRLQEELGVVADFADTAQLAKSFEYGQLPAIADMSMVVGVSPADMGEQTGWYARRGQTITVHGFVAWENANGAIDANSLELQLPFQSSVISGRDAGTVFIVNSNLLSDNALGPWFGVQTQGPATDALIARATTAIGAVSNPVTVGDGDVEGANRLIQYEITYCTNGVRNALWPAVVWVPTGDQPHLVLPDITYYGAQAGDFVSVRDNADVEVQSVAVVGLPSATIPINAALTKAGGSPYTLVHRGQRSRPLVVLAP